MEISYRLELLLKLVAMQPGEEFTSFVTNQQSNERDNIFFGLCIFKNQLLCFVLCIYIIRGVFIYRNAFSRKTLLDLLKALPFDLARKLIK